jgi:molecular chaperone DnaK
MRTLTIALASASLLACSSQKPTVAEESSPIVGADGTTVQALGFASPYGEFLEVIPRGAKVPCSAAQLAPTAHRDANRYELALYRGTGTDVQSNQPLGRYSAPRTRTAAGKPARVQITFSIDADRRITLSAKDLDSGRAVPLTKLP